MKRNFTILTGLIALILFVTPVLAGDTPACNHAQKGACADSAHKAACCDMKGVTMKVANTDKGATVTLTGETAEAVKAIQDHATKCAKHECGAAKEGKAGCCDQATCPMKDAKVQVTNNDKGAVITVTSDKPETVTAIQKCMADCHGAKHEAHDQKTEAQTKAKADACGKCPMKSDCAKKPAPEKEIK
jgi:hypothetical protein